MPAAPLDPAPRVYPPSVFLIRRADRGPAAAPQRTTLEAIEAWLLGEARREDDLLRLMEGLVWRMVAAGLPLDRASLHVGTLHPQALGFAWNWTREDGFVDEVRVVEAVLRTDAYRRNPIFRVIEHGETFRADCQDPAVAGAYPLMAELAKQGMTEYLALPVGGRRYHNVATAATKRPGGFGNDHLAAINRIYALFGLHAERQILQLVARNVLDTYLGVAAGGRVLEGSIKRGAGESMHAVVWISDMRGFTDLTERLAGPDVIAILNAYFEVLAGAVMDHGGEVLKFIGDGLLAVFPFAAFPDEATAAKASLAAAEQALDAVEALNAAPPAPLDSIAGWRPLRSGIALHEGEVFFGNVGAPERLDFTAIGRAVNEASRVEALTKALGRPILITEPVAGRLDGPLDDLGRHPLRGLPEPIAVFSPYREEEG